MRWLAVLSSAAVLTSIRASPLSIGLETSWPAPPLILEILETVCDESPSSYFPLLQLFTTHIPPETSDSPKELLSTALELISSHGLLSKPTSLSTLNYALGLHTAAPRIEAFYNWYEGSVDEARLGVEGCGSWVEWRGKGFCDVESLKSDMELTLEEREHHPFENPVHLPFDHMSTSTPSNSTAVLYLDSSSSTSSSLLNYLVTHESADISFQYMVRYKPPAGERVRKTPVSGYGVELALKKTDYLVVDDRATRNQAADRGNAKGINSESPFKTVLGSDPWSELSNPLSKEEIAEIGLKASSLIMSSGDKLNALVHLTQDFPTYSAALARKVDVNSAISDRIPDMFQQGQPPLGIYLNGKLYEGSTLDAFSLLKAVRTERDLMLSLTSTGLTPRQAFQLISDPLIGQRQCEDEPGDGIVDASDRHEGGDVIMWWNDIEKDKRYKSWSSGVQAYLRPLYPGQMHTVRKNTFNVVFVLDLALKTSLEIINEQIIAMIKGGIPIRFGVVPMFDRDVDDTSLAMAKLLPYCIKFFGRGYTQEFLAKIISMTPGTPASPGIVSREIIKFAYETIAEESGKVMVPFDQFLNSDDSGVLAAMESYTTRLAATKAESPIGHLFLNGKYFPANSQWMAFIQSELMSQVGFVQQQLMAGAVGDDTISTMFYDLPSTSLRRNKLIVPNPLENKLKVVNLGEVFQTSAAQTLQKDMLYPTDKGEPIAMSMWIIGDLNAAESRGLVEDGVEYINAGTNKTRLGFIHVPDPSSPTRHGLSTHLHQLHLAGDFHKISPTRFQETSKIFDSDCEECGENGVYVMSTHRANDEGGMSEEEESRVISTGEEATQYWNEVGTPVADVLGLKSSRPHILINGRLIGPITPGSFAKEDFAALEAYEYRRRVKPVVDLLQTMDDDMSVLDRATLADLVSTTSSVIGSAYAASDDGIFTPMPVARSWEYERLNDGALSFSLGDPETAILNVAAVLDPVSEAAQRSSYLLKVLSEMEQVAITVHLAPTPLMTELPLKRFYRFALASRLRFDVDGNDVSPQIVFEDLPSTPIFTLGMDTPPAWIVSPSHSPFDLDNLVLGNVREPVHVSFQLKQLLIEGHARDANNAPPRGLQLQLTGQGMEVVSDTQVMANLGYMQFKATPGIYHLAIRPGRGTQVYELESVGNDGWDSEGVNVTGTRVALSSFDGVTLLPRFVRKPGMEMANVLVDDVPQQASYTQAVFSRMKQMVGMAPAPVPPATTQHADINIFTVASGLLYERFASIMILSVMKNTKSTVKFWFIENFLSPEFLEFLPRMADEYGFQYEFVTYKWPHWLRAQTEKQRIIWAYKILFLDVLFPMDLDKVIFVDADQIVRVDMKELVDVDLQGHVYGYPPMGNSREEMEGFRFWKSGYWKEALRGRPYHISALYVVDLKRFRQLATGDRLRGQYHALSADPNSLANLDQDLPNSMQDQIPIFTLDQDWLWCQTWCSDESLETAKTIDLCQNPLTKEPKLVRARQIPEWDEYDQEIAAFAARISEGGGAGLAASVDDLASGPAKGLDTGSSEGTVEDDTVEHEQREDSTGHLDDEL